MLVVTHLPSVSGLHMASVSRATSTRTLLSMPSVCVCVLSVTASFQSSVWRLRALRSVKTEDQRETLPPFSGGGEEGGGGSEAGPSPPTATFFSEVPKMFWQRFNSDSLTQTLSLVSVFLCIFFFPWRSGESGVPAVISVLLFLNASICYCLFHVMFFWWSTFT